MKHILHTAGLCLIAAASSAQADEILIYKYSSSRPWVEYTCLRPDAVNTPAAPVVPKTTLSGTYTITEYWVVNKTKKEYSKVYYQARNSRGAVEKTYSWDYAPSPFTRTDASSPTTPVTVSTFHALPAKAANTYNISLHFGHQNDYEGPDGTGYFSTEQGNLQGLGKPFALSKTLALQGVAPALKGPYLSSYRDDTTIYLGTDEVPVRTLYLEKPTTHTLTLDTKATQRANTGSALVPYGGGAAVPSGSIPHGIRVVGLLLEATGYDFEAGYGSGS